MVDKTIDDFGTIGAPATIDLLLVWDDSAGTTHKMPLSSLLAMATSAEGASFHLEQAAPTGADGDNGDVWYRTDTSQIWGPKTGGAWGAAYNVGGGSTTVDLAAASGAVDLDLSTGNIFDVDMSGAITSWTLSNVTGDGFGMLRVTNNSGGTLAITWTGLDVPAGTATSLLDGEELRAFIGWFA